MEEIPSEKRVSAEDIIGVRPRGIAKYLVERGLARDIKQANIRLALAAIVVVAALLLLLTSGSAPDSGAPSSQDAPSARLRL